MCVCVSVKAQDKYLACIAAQQEWRQIHHLCYWELMWAYSFEQNWKEAYRYADHLCKESKWSQVPHISVFHNHIIECLLIVFAFPSYNRVFARFFQAIYVFQKAAILSMLPEEEVTKMGENVVQLFRCASERTVNNPYSCVANNQCINCEMCWLAGRWKVSDSESQGNRSQRRSLQQGRPSDTLLPTP